MSDDGFHQIDRAQGCFGSVVAVAFLLGLALGALLAGSPLLAGVALGGIIVLALSLLKVR